MYCFKWNISLCGYVKIKIFTKLACNSESESHCWVDVSQCGDSLHMAILITYKSSYYKQFFLLCVFQTMTKCLNSVRRSCCYVSGRQETQYSLQSTSRRMSSCIKWGTVRTAHSLLIDTTVTCLTLPFLYYTINHTSFDILWKMFGGK